MGWFRPKRFGYGANPSGWKGWLLTVGYIALTIFLLLNGWVLAFLGSMLVFIALSWMLTDGEWRWRWGSNG